MQYIFFGLCCLASAYNLASAFRDAVNQTKSTEPHEALGVLWAILAVEIWRI